MVKSETVILITGAGASVPYRYPDGMTLTASIVSQCLDDPDRGQMCQLTRLAVEGCPDLKEMGRRLKDSEYYSIDAFLEPEGHKHFRNAGRAAIAFQLLQAEKEVLRQWLEAPPADDWMRLLFNQLRENAISPEKLPAEQVKVITFNFDCFLEYRWRRSLLASYPLSPQEALEVAHRSLEVIHVNGSLMPDNLLDEPPATARGFGDPFNQTHIKSYVPQIGLFHDGAKSGSLKVRIQSLLFQADVIAFLGFSFNAMNVAKLGLPDVLELRESKSKPPPRIYASMYHMHPAQVERAKKTVLGGSSYVIDTADFNDGCVATLQKFPILI